MFDKKDGDKSGIRTLSIFKKAIKSAIVVDPAEGTFNLPALAAVFFMSNIFWRTSARFRDMIFTKRNDGDDSALAQGAAMALAVKTLVQPQSFGAAPTFANMDSINGFKQLGCVMSIGRAQSHIQWMTIAVNHQMPFEAFYMVLSRISNMFFRPLFDLTTLAS